MSPPPRLSVTPADGLIDEARSILVTGLRPGEIVTLQSRTLRGGGLAWRSEARYAADRGGVVDTARDLPVAGDYSRRSAMGLIWSQSPEQPPAAGLPALFPEDVTRPLVTSLRLSAGSGNAEATLTQRLAADGVSRREVRDDGLVGTLFTPPGPGPHPAVIVLNGSGGGLNEPRAALYASRGYQALALAYFKAPGLSPFISNTRIEYFKTALDWVRRHCAPAHGFVALSGQSRGGELVLLLGSLFPDDVSAVVAYVPSALVHGGQNAADPAVGRDGPAWLYQGAPLRHVWQDNATASWAPWDEGPEPRRHTLAMLTALQDPAAVERARIPVERVRGPILLLSGTDDGSWPSSLYSRLIMERLAQAGHPYPDRHLDYEEAGHSILFPYAPTTQTSYAHPVSGRRSTSGGHPGANAIANQDSWASVLQFLAQAVALRR